MPKPEGDAVPVSSPSEQEAKILEPAKAPREESVSSESEEEAEYHPNVSVSISHTQIPEEKEEELEQEVKKEEKMVEPVAAASDVSSASAEVSQPVEAASREEEAEPVKKNTEEEKEEEKEVVGSADVPVIPPEEAPNGVTLSAEGATTAPAPVEEEEEPKMNGEASLAETESRPQVICCSEVKSSLGPPAELPWASTLPPDLAAPVCFSLLLLSVWVSPSCLREHLSPVSDLTLVFVSEIHPE